MDEDRSHEALLVFGFARMRERFLRGARVRVWPQKVCGAGEGGGCSQASRMPTPTLIQARPR